MSKFVITMSTEPGGIVARFVFDQARAGEAQMHISRENLVIIADTFQSGETRCPSCDVPEGDTHLSQEGEATAEQTAALQAYADRKGSFWKQQLIDAWIAGADEREPDSHLLRQVRNQLGPTWLLDVCTITPTPKQREVRSIRMELGGRCR